MKCCKYTTTCCRAPSGPLPRHTWTGRTLDRGGDATPRSPAHHGEGVTGGLSGCKGTHVKFVIGDNLSWCFYYCKSLYVFVTSEMLQIHECMLFGGPLPRLRSSRCQSAESGTPRGQSHSRAAPMVSREPHVEFAASPDAKGHMSSLSLLITYHGAFITVSHCMFL